MWGGCKRRAAPPLTPCCVGRGQILLKSVKFKQADVSPSPVEVRQALLTVDQLYSAVAQRLAHDMSKKVRDVAAHANNRHQGRESAAHCCMLVCDQILGVVGSADALGNPSGFVRHLRAGTADAMTLPVSGLAQSPFAMASGLATGYSSLVRNTMAGMFGSVGCTR